MQITKWTDIINIESPILYSLDCREGHVKRNRFVAVCVCVRVKGQVLKTEGYR